MKMTQREITPRKKARWSAGVLLAGFLLGSLLPSLNWRVQAAPHRAVALDVVINEVAWMGTSDNWRDEWIELHNPTSSSIDLTGWVLTDGDDIDEVEEEESPIELSPESDLLDPSTFVE